MKLKKWLIILSCSSIAGSFLGGCMKSNIVAPEESLRMEPETGTIENIPLDWGEIGAEVESTYENPELYPVSDSVNYQYIPELKHFQLTITVKEDAELEDIAAYTLAVIKGINDMIATQDFSYARSSDTSFGGFFDENDLQLMVIPGDMYTPEEHYILNTTIPAGEYYEFYTKDDLGFDPEELNLNGEEDSSTESGAEVSETEEAQTTQAEETEE